MQANKLIQLLNTLKPKELRDFEKYLMGGYRKYEIALALFHYIRKYHIGKAEARLDVGKVVGEIQLEGDDKTQKQILNEASRLYKWLEDYLILKKLQEKGNLTREKLLAEIFRERQLSHLFQLKVGQVLRGYIDKGPADIWSIIDSLSVQHFQYHYSDPFEGLHTKDRKTLQRIMAKLDDFIIAAKLQYGNELINRANILQEENEIQMWDEIKQLAAIQGDQSTILIKTLRLATDLLERQDLVSYEKLKAFFMENYASLSFETMQTLNGYLINFAARLIKESHYDWVEEVFELYDFSMEERLFFEEGLISSIRFINIINVACNLQKLEWAEAFIEKWRTFLRKEIQKITVAVATALVRFEQTEFGEVLEILRERRNQDPFLEVRIRALIIMSMIEEEQNFQVILDHCRNFKTYLHRSKVLGDQTVTGFTNFLQIIQQIVVSERACEELISQVNDYQVIFCKTWLLKKIGAGKTSADLGL